jgi:hypothetical protein
MTANKNNVFEVSLQMQKLKSNKTTYSTRDSLQGLIFVAGTQHTYKTTKLNTQRLIFEASF